MTPSSFNALLEVARKHKVAAFALGELRVTFEPLLMDSLEDAGPKTKAQLAAQAERDDDVLFHSSTP